MRQICQLAYILLYLQFFICNGFTFNLFQVDTLSKEIVSNVISNVMNIISINKQKCNSNDDCAVTNSVCNNGLCQCGPGYISSADLTSCIKVATGFNAPCNETVQCSAYLFSGAQCEKNVCICGSNYYYFHGRCNRHVGLFEKCKENIDCYVNAEFEASTCDTVDGICKCSSDFYQREHRTCRRKGKDINDECILDIDCTFPNATCTNEYICAVKSESDEVALLSDAAVSSTNDIVDKEIRVNKCKTNEDCKALENAVCDPTGICQCNRAHFLSDSGEDAKCIPELGEPCQENDVQIVNIEKSICREGRWSCIKGTVATKDNRKCRKVTKKYEGSCELDEQCYIFGPDASCSNKKCVCNKNVSHYVESELFCWISKKAGEDCKENQDCYMKDFKGELICNGTCGCLDGKHLNEKKTACIDNNSTELGGVCEVDSDCATPHSICQKEMCLCADFYYPSNDQCLAGINSTCVNSEDCTPENSECNSAICSCQPNYVAVDTDLCIPILSFGESCSLDIQCSANVTGAICASVEESINNIADTIQLSKTAENKICTCSKGDHYKFGKCFKKKLLDETCTNLGECYLDENLDQEIVVCKKGKCACDWGYMKLNNSTCVRDTPSLSLNGGVNGVPTELFLIIFFILSCKLII